MSNTGHCLTQHIARDVKEVTDKWEALEDEESDPESEEEDEEGGQEAFEGLGEVYELY